MRNAVIGLATGLLLAALLSDGWNFRDTAYGQLPPREQAGAGTTLATWETPTGQHLAVLDPVNQVLSVYEINRTSGAIALKSVRNITWDVQMEEFNAVSPLPREIRAILQRR